MGNSTSRFLDMIAPALLLALTLAGAYQRQIPAVVLSASILMGLLLTRWWSRHSLDLVECSTRLEPQRGFQADEVTLSVRVDNRKLLPLPWTEIDVRTSWTGDAVSVVEPEGAAVSELGELRMAGSLSWHERLAWRYRLSCKKRGIYRVGPATITSGDPFGFFSRSARFECGTRLIVYPRLIPVERMGLPPGFPLGDARAERWIFEDPSRTVGVREYRPEDAFRHIHWKATSRRQQLQVRVHEPTTTVQIALFLAVDGDGKAGEPFERAVSAVASLASLLLERHHPVGIYVNGGTRGSDSPTEVPPGSSDDQLPEILESLAGVEPVSCAPISQYLGETAGRLPWGCSLVLVAERLPAEIGPVLEAARAAGRRVSVLTTGAGLTANVHEGGGAALDAKW